MKSPLTGFLTVMTIAILFLLAIKISLRIHPSQAPAPSNYGQTCDLSIDGVCFDRTDGHHKIIPFTDADAQRVNQSLKCYPPMQQTPGEVYENDYLPKLTEYGDPYTYIGTSTANPYALPQ